MAPLEATIRRCAALLLLAGAAASCDAPTSPPDGARLRVEVAPLALADVVNATYEVVVENAAGQTVWSRTADSRRYGDGAGSLALVGPCDADAPLHTITLTLTGLEDATRPRPARDVSQPDPHPPRRHLRPRRGRPGHFRPHDRARRE